jgi:hypothetical protein
MGYSEHSEYPRGIVHVDMATSPVAVFPAGQKVRIAGWILVHNAAAASHVVQLESADGAIEYAHGSIAAQTTIPVPIGFLASDGLRVTCDPASADVDVIIYYWDD